MNHFRSAFPFAAALVVTSLLAACDRPTVINNPAPAPVAVPGPAGAPGATGATGATGNQGNTGSTGDAGSSTSVIIMPPASAPASN